MAKNFEGKLVAKGLKFGIVVSRFNHFIADRLLEGALDAIRRNGANEEDCSVVWVPGSFEIPLVAKKLANSRRYDAVICLGCVIRGATPHYAYIAAVSLAGRLFANMTAGHVMLAVLFSLTIGGGLLIGWLPFAFTVGIYGLEFGIAFIQAYIFSILTCVYLGDAFHLHGHDEHAH